MVRQARRQGHSEKTELGILLVHGFLHLLGWDHRTPAETQETWRLTWLAWSSALIVGMVVMSSSVYYYIWGH